MYSSYQERLYRPTIPVFDCSETGCLPACWCLCSIGQRHQTLNHQFLIFSYRRAFFFPFYYYCRARRIIKAVDRVPSCLSEPSTHRWFVMYKVGNHFSAQFVFYARSCSSSFFCSNKYHFLFSRGNNISLTVADVSTMASSSSPPVKALLNV